MKQLEVARLEIGMAEQVPAKQQAGSTLIGFRSKPSHTAYDRLVKVQI